MTHKEFDKVLEERIAKIRTVLTSKAAEYSGDENDRLHNFNVAARVDNESREESLWGMAKKHLVSIIDIKNKVAKDILPERVLLSEKIGDMINYLILLEASIIDKIDKKENKYNEVECKCKK